MTVPAGTDIAGALVCYSLVTSRRDGTQAGYVLRNAAVGAGLVAEARRRGLTWHELGLAHLDADRGLRVGLASAAAIVTVVSTGTAVAATHPAGRRLLDDRRAAIGRRALAWQTLGRIPVGTAAFEEVAFRAVLLGALSRRHGPAWGVVGSSVVFGLWHIGPTLAALRINGVATGRVRASAGAVAATTVGGLLFGGLRVAGGHVAAPWLAHWAINAATLVAARRAQRTERRRPRTHTCMRRRSPARTTDA